MPSAVGARTLIGCPWRDVNAMLQFARLRPTRQRVALGWLLFGKGGRHLTAEMLYEEATPNQDPGLPHHCLQHAQPFVRSGIAAAGLRRRQQDLFRYQHQRAPSLLFREQLRAGGYSRPQSGAAEAAGSYQTATRSPVSTWLRGCAGSTERTVASIVRPASAWRFEDITRDLHARSGFKAATEPAWHGSAHT